MKLLMMALLLFASCAFAKNQESPGNPGTAPTPPNRYPTRLELLSVILNQPTLAKLHNSDANAEQGYVLKDVSMQFPKGDTEPLQVSIQIGSSDAKWHSTTYACARVDYTDVPGKLSDGTEAVKLADQWAFIRFTGGGCN